MSVRNRVLVYRTGHLGDTVCAIPAFRLIRSHFADAELILFCDEPQESKVPAYEVVEKLQIFDHIVTYTSGRGLLSVGQLVRAVRTVRPGLLIMLPQARETAEKVQRKRWLFKRCGVPDVRGFQPP